MQPTAGDWQTAGGRTTRNKFTWNELLWSLIFPRRKERIKATTAGILLIALAMGIGMAAYNAANNILFITLSLLLACLILSGILSWINFRRIAWRLQIMPPLRVGQEAVVTLGLRNTKKIVPTYGLWFELVARAVERGPAAKAESTLTARGAEVRAALTRANAAETRERLYLQARLDPGSDVAMEWTFKPKQRGKLYVELESVGSLFPFGFLSKSISAGLRVEGVVWPAPVDYQRLPALASRRAVGGERMARAGSGSDLLALRRYERGDSHGLIHWKASARTGQLLVRQLAAETMEKFAVWVRTDHSMWSRQEQFELMVSFVATLAEDLFRASKLSSVSFDNEPPIPIRRVSDLEALLDRLSVLDLAQPVKSGEKSVFAQRSNVVTFAPEGPHGVTAWVQGQKMAVT